MDDHHQNQEERKINPMGSTAGYCYSHHNNNPNSIQSHMVDQFDSNPADQIYNLSTGMDISTIGYQSTALWHDQEGSDRIAIGADHDHTRSLPFDDSSLRCVFPCEGNERPSQGLSLSLSSANPSSIGLQSFELRHQQQQRQQSNPDHEMIGSGFGGSGSRPDHHRLFGKSVMEDGYVGKSGNLHQFVQIRNSKYLGPAQDLLNEFCNLGLSASQTGPKGKTIKPHHHQESTTAASTSTAAVSKNKSLYGNSSIEIMELQKRKSKLFSMLEEVDRRYRHYCDQMKAVVASFEAVAGHGAAGVYSTLASKAMSRHFRCLRDGIVGQIKATKEAMGEKDAMVPGASRGETPRLRLLDQTLRQQKAVHQMSLMESHPWRPQRGLPERSVSVLRAWLFEHFLHPYPSDVDKHILARQTGLSRSQVSNWFINARVRLWKPMVEEMYLEETKEQESNSMGLGASSSDDMNIRANPNSLTRPEDQKPTPDQLVRIDSECLSSIINNPEKNDTKHMMSKSPQNLPPDHRHHHHQPPHQLSFGRVGDTFGAIELDFSSYNHHRGGVSYHNDQNAHHHHQPSQQLSFGRVGDTFGAIELDFSSYNHHRGGVSYHNDQNAHQNFGGGGGGGGGSGGGVSLTLGLQQHGGNGVSLAFSPSTSQSSLFYPRDHIEDCQPVQYSIMDEAQNLPYRNLMGAQLLHDLTG